MISQLRIAKSKEFKMPSAHGNSILQCPIDACVNFVELFSISRGLDLQLVFVSD